MGPISDIDMVNNYRYIFLQTDKKNANGKDLMGSVILLQAVRISRFGIFYFLLTMLTDCYLQHYSMDCYFRQYWRDTRLSFKGLKMNSNQLHINQLSLNVKMLGRNVRSQQDPKLIILYLIYLEMAVFYQTT